MHSAGFNQQAVIQNYDAQVEHEKDDMRRGGARGQEGKRGRSRMREDQELEGGCREKGTAATDGLMSSILKSLGQTSGNHGFFNHKAKDIGEPLLEGQNEQTYK